MTETRNNAKTVLKYMERARKYDPKNTSTTAFDAWKYILCGNPEASDQEALKRILAVQSLLYKIENEIRDISNSEEEVNLYTKTFEGMISLFDYRRLPNQWNPRAIADTHLQALEFCSMKLHESFSEQEIPSKEIVELQKAINDLVSDIKKTSLDTNLKKLLLDLLRAAQEGLDAYELNGIVGVKSAIESIMGKILLNQDLWKCNQEVEEVKKTISVVSKIFNWVVTYTNKIKILTTGMDSTEKALETLEKLIGSGS